MIESSAAKDAVLVMWGTWPKLPLVLDVMVAWGFEFVTGFPWIKLNRNGSPRSGVGFWTRGCTEYVLIGKRGKPNRKMPRTETPVGLLLPGSVFYATRPKQHSEKPLGLHEWLEKMFPDVRRVELFARRERVGWDCYGLDLGWSISPDGIAAARIKHAGGNPEPLDPALEGF